ncbi:sensor histidine kinase [Cellulosilyticum sp. I15G10I2]|uniref:sensor histidine kinase n=1 Tax=Cellulosilyticum sp. I15G10I2 TaxID=1892843 RepID=UPI00085CD59A|nr:HAMP domain-containing sensor histidine kinase [Cellulosilyticum sp. I15G10I2]
MIPIRKQLFGILLGIGVLIIVSISLAVNIAIKRHFELYVETNIKHAGDVIVKLLADLYENDRWNHNLREELTVETYMGNFAVSVLTPDKELIWGTTQEQLLDKIRNKDNRYLGFSAAMPYRFEDRPIYSKQGVLIGYARIGYFASTLLSGNDLKFQRDVNETILLCSTTILGCFVVAGLYISRLFTHHIYGIAKTSIDLAEGKLTARYDCKSKIKEIETLRYSMNHLAERLEKQDCIRKKLISDVSHEIRTPLHILQSNLEAMIDGFYPIDEEQMQILHKEVVRFGKLLSNLDSLKNVEERVMSMAMEPLILNESLKDVFDAFKILAQEKKIKYVLKDSETQHVRILGDKDSLKQLWMNILSNAFKFTDMKGEITVTTAVKPKECSIIIQDTGLGIAKEDLPYIFERMYRGDKSREKYEGSGLGLTIVKSIVSFHKGRIDIDSIEGEGTKVTITLPSEERAHVSQNISNKVKSYMKLGTKN